jgi:hypothetical protein
MMSSSVVQLPSPGMARSGTKFQRMFSIGSLNRSKFLSCAPMQSQYPIKEHGTIIKIHIFQRRKFNTFYKIKKNFFNSTQISLIVYVNKLIKTLDFELLNLNF